jgi:hypothetical protein
MFSPARMFAFVGFQVRDAGKPPRRKTQETDRQRRHRSTSNLHQPSKPTVSRANPNPNTRLLAQIRGRTPVPANLEPRPPTFEDCNANIGQRFPPSRLHYPKKVHAIDRRYVAQHTYVMPATATNITWHSRHDGESRWSFFSPPRGFTLESPNGLRSNLQLLTQPTNHSKNGLLPLLHHRHSLRLRQLSQRHSLGLRQQRNRNSHGLPRPSLRLRQRRRRVRDGKPRQCRANGWRLRAAIRPNPDERRRGRRVAGSRV